MIQIKRNKFLTKIINNEQVSSIPTKIFDEITGVNSLEYTKDLIFDKAANYIEVEKKIMDDVRRAYAQGVSYASISNYGPDEILIDDTKVPFKKVLESWDLTYGMLRSAINNAILFTTDERIQCDNYSYIEGVKKIVNSYLKENAPFESKKFSPKFTNIHRSTISNPQKHSALCGTQLLTTLLIFESPKDSFYSNGASINIYTPDETMIDNLVDTTDKIYFNFSLFYNDEEWYFQELSRESIEKILSKYREFAQSVTSSPPDSVMVSKIFQTFWHQSIQGLKSGTIVLQDIFGYKKMFAIKDLIPKPKYLLQQHMGKYLSTKTSKWKEDVSNYIL